MEGVQLARRSAATDVAARPQGRGLRALVRLLCFLLVPVVVVGTPQVAQAAATYGSPTSGTISAGGRYDEATGSKLAVPLTGSWVECYFNAYWVVGEGPGTPVPSVKVVQGTCDRGWQVDLSARGPDCDAEDCSEIRGEFRGVDPESETSCSVPFTFDLGTNDWTFSGLVPASTPSGCDVTTACTTVYHHYVNNGQDSDLSGDGCRPFALGAPPDVSSPEPTLSTCEHFDPAQVHVWTDKTFPDPPGYGTQTGPYTVLHAEIKGIRKTSAATMLPPHVAYRDTAGGAIQWTSLSPSGAMYTQGDGFMGYAGTAVDGRWPIIVGIAFMSSPYSSTSDATQQALPAKRRLSGWATKSGGTAGKIGTNDPNNCLWWFGEKIAADDPASSLDDPHGDVSGAPSTPTEPTPEPVTDAPTKEDTTVDTCDFSWTDPATWASGGICRLVRLVTGLIEEVKAVPTRILGGLNGLFVPVNAPSFSSVGSPLPSGWLPSLPDLDRGACGAVTMPSLELGFRDWTVGPVQMVDTCDDPWPLVRTLTYFGLLLMVSVGAAWFVFRAVTSGVGMGVATGSDGGDDR